MHLQPNQYASWLKKAHDPEWTEHRYRTAQDRAMVSAILDLEEALARLAQKWISVKERLPEMPLTTNDVHYSERVLVSAKGKILVADLNQWRDETPRWNDDSGCYLEGVTRWQPLPAPPR